MPTPVIPIGVQLPVFAYQPGVYSVSTNTGGGTDPGSVSWRLEGHYFLNQTGMVAIQNQVLSYLNNVASGAFSAQANAQTFYVTPTTGHFLCDNSNQNVQAASINAILGNTANLGGVA